MNTANTMKQVIYALRKVVSDFQDNPYAYLYEEDIRATMFAELRSRMADEFSVKGTDHPESVYKLRNVYCEYGYKIDIACLDFTVNPTPTPHKGYDTYIYSLPVLVGIELKFMKIGDKFTVKESIKDYRKMQQAKVRNGLAIAFIQNELYLPDFIDGKTGEEPNWPRLMSRPDGILIVTKSKVLDMTPACIEDTREEQ